MEVALSGSRAEAELRVMRLLSQSCLLTDEAGECRELNSWLKAAWDKSDKSEERVAGTAQPTPHSKDTQRMGWWWRSQRMRREQEKQLHLEREVKDAGKYIA